MNEERKIWNENGSLNYLELSESQLSINETVSTTSLGIKKLEPSKLLLEIHSKNQFPKPIVEFQPNMLLSHGGIHHLV